MDNANSFKKDGKFNKIADNGRTVVYPNGYVTFQPIGESHSDYAKNLRADGPRIDPVCNDLLNVFRK